MINESKIRRCDKLMDQIGDLFKKVRILNIKLTTILVLLSQVLSSQIANFVTNGGLEKHYTCNTNSNSAGYVVNAEGWFGVGNNNADRYAHYCIGLVPFNGFFYNYPRHDSAYVLFDVYCLTCSPFNNRTYVRNKLKTKLEAGKTYCVRYHVNLSEYSAYSINKIGAYFGGNPVDTITKGQYPLTYLVPQIEPAANSFPMDTVGWTLISSTFTANGDEKYMVIGNFRSNAGTDTLRSCMWQLAQSYSACTIALDDVSCIPIDLPAFAGHDTTCIPGTTVYLGRSRDVGIDEACTWYKLPKVITPTTPAIDTAAGIWVSPSETSTYVVRQDICGMVKWDTVVVYKNAVGIKKNELFDGAQGRKLKIGSSPVSDHITVRCLEPNDGGTFQLTDISGKIILHGEFKFSGNEFALPIDVENGVYFIQIRNEKMAYINKKMIVQR